jgi:manganese/zinc/iron transport system permease protein
MSSASILSDLWQLLTLQDYNARVVLLGTGLLGASSGLVGAFLMLRKRALVSDAVAHATLPGVVVMFMLRHAFGSDPRSLPWLLLGGALAGWVGMLAVSAITRLTRLKDDAALGIVLSVLFGLGMALLQVATQLPGGQATGLSHLIFAKTASMLLSDALLIAGGAIVVLLLCLGLRKELTLLSFDADFAAVQGWPTLRLDALLMLCIVTTTVIGLQAVGLILVVALLVIPPVAARYWSDRMGLFLLISVVLGGAGGVLGSALSALFSSAPTGPVIVLTCAGLFVFSLLFGRARGVLWKLLRGYQLRRDVARQHVLRALYELAEEQGGKEPLSARRLKLEDLLLRRSWSREHVAATIRGLVKDDLVVADGTQVRLTLRGEKEAAVATRNHRLWEHFLITHAEVAPSRVDRGADRIEHVLDRDLVEELERQFPGELPGRTVPSNPHGGGVA